jgi:outer membrane protein OmpA-like peptidoglycan-associated protein
MGSISMRNKNLFTLLLCLACGMVLIGCGGGKRSSKKKDLAENVIEDPSEKIPVYQFEADEFFDASKAGLAFVDGEVGEENVEESEAAIVAENDVHDDWDDEKMSLAWRKEEETSDLEVVNFDLNKNSIRDDQKLIVAKNISVVDKAIKEGKNVVVAGYTCQLGSDSFNMSLSERRARTVRDEMVKKGIPSDKIQIVGFGSERPVVLSDAQNRGDRVRELAPNRRAEIELSID